MSQPSLEEQVMGLSVTNLTSEAEIKHSKKEDRELKEERESER